MALFGLTLIYVSNCRLSQTPTKLFHESDFFDRVNVRLMLNPQRNPPLVHELLVLGINWFSRMAVELVKIKLKTCPPVSISRPTPRGL